VKDAVAPVVTLTDDGCVVMIGGLVEGAAGDADVPPPPQPCSAMNTKQSAIHGCRKRYSQKFDSTNDIGCGRPA